MPPTVRHIAKPPLNMRQFTLRCVDSLSVSHLVSNDHAFFKHRRRLPVVAMIAYFAFGEVPDRWVWLGGALIALSGLYIAQREAKLRPPPAPAAARSKTPG